MPSPFIILPWVLTLLLAAIAAVGWLRVRRLGASEQDWVRRWDDAMRTLGAADVALWRWSRPDALWSFEPEDAGPAGHDFLARLHREDAERVLEAVSEAAGPDAFFRVQARWNDDRDSDRAVELTGRAAREPEEYVGVARDCSEDRRRVAELSHSSQLLAQVHDAIISTDLDGSILTWNAGAEKLYGYAAPEAAGRHIELIYFDEDRERVDEQMTAAVLASGAYEFVGRFRHRSGYPLSASVRLALLRDETDSPVGVVSCSHDVTKQREREEAFQLRARVLENMQEGVCLTDRRGVVLHTNPACDQMFAPPGRGLVGRRLGCILHDDHTPPQRNAHEDAPVAESVRRALEESDNWTGELTGVAWEGRTIQVSARVSSLVLTEGVFWVWVLEDVTQRKRDLAALEERESRFRMMADSAPVMVWMSDPRGRCTYVNAEWVKLTGLSLEESSGAGWLEAIPEDDQRLWDAGVRERFELREPLDCEIRLRRRDGERRWALVRGVPRFDGSGAFNGYIGSAIDITDRKLAEEERRELLRRSERQHKIEALGVMAGGIAHDFNNLLVSMLGHAELALEEVESEEARRSVTRFQEAARRAAELTNQILAFSGRRRPRVELMRFSQTVRETLPLIQPSMDASTRVEIETGEEALINADPGQLRQVIMNLLLNASDASQERGGVIHVRTGTTDVGVERLAAAVGGDGLEGGRYVFLEVEDQGAGIAPDILKSVFDPFFTTKFTGRGLGLAAALGVVRGHSGAIELRSKPGSGTLFRVLLPAGSGSVSAVAEPAPVERRGTETILLVDDDLGVLGSTQRMLERWGYRVYTATGGREAIAHLAEAPDEVDLALVDVVMPGITAGATIEGLRQLRRDLPIVIWSGYYEPESAAELLGLPTSGFLRKPFSSSQLAAQIRGALSRAPARTSAASNPG